VSLRDIGNIVPSYSTYGIWGQPGYNKGMNDSIFTKIINGDIPAHRIYEDDRVIAFLDINPVTEGHTLVIPKQQVDHLWDLDDETYHYLMEVTKKVALRIREVLNPPRVAQAVDGFEVAHAHIHLFPAYKGLNKTIVEHAAKDHIEPDHTALAAVADKLRFS